MTRPVTSTKVATNGAEALQMLQDTNTSMPEIIFLDLNMPGMDGFAFLDALKARNGSLSDKLKVVILSSSIDVKDISRSKEYKTVINFISKPLTFDALSNLSPQFNPEPAST